MTPQDAIAVLLKAKWTEMQIGKAVGVSQPVINRVHRGLAETRYSVGKALVDLAQSVKLLTETSPGLLSSRRGKAANQGKEGDAAETAPPVLKDAA